jgi:hypothetical protein
MPGPIEARKIMRTLPLADEFFLVGHDEYTGKPMVNAEVLDTGLAGAVVGELIMSGRLSVADTGLVTARDQRPYGERVTDAAMAEVLKQPEAHPIRAWIEYLRTEVRNMVAPRLVQTGMVQRVQSSGMLRKSVRFPAVEPIKAAAPRARLRYMLDHPAYLDGHTAVLGGLTRATGLEHVLGAGTSREARDSLSKMVEALPLDLRLLCGGVDQAVAAVALTVRR